MLHERIDDIKQREFFKTYKFFEKLNARFNLSKHKNIDEMMDWYEIPQTLLSVETDEEKTDCPVCKQKQVITRMVQQRAMDEGQDTIRFCVKCQKKVF